MSTLCHVCPQRFYFLAIFSAIFINSHFEQSLPISSFFKQALSFADFFVFNPKSQSAEQFNRSQMSRIVVELGSFLFVSQACQQGCETPMSFAMVA